MEKIFTKEAMEFAVAILLDKKDSCGVDGIYVSEYGDYFELNGDRIREEVISGRYKPNAVQLVEMLKRNGKRRTISNYTCTDRVILEVLKSYLT